MRGGLSALGVVLLIALIVLILIYVHVLTFTSGGCDSGHGMLIQLGTGHICVGGGVH